MKKIVSIILSATILMLIAISPVSANNDYEDNGDFRYIDLYFSKSQILKVGCLK